jgi:hypothetical protein
VFDSFPADDTHDSAYDDDGTLCCSILKSSDFTFFFVISCYKTLLVLLQIRNTKSRGGKMILSSKKEIKKKMKTEDEDIESPP